MTTTKLAKRATNLKPSFLREILKLTQRPEIISFAGGLPNPSLFPITELASIAKDVLETEGKEALQYTITPGYPALRQWIYDRYYQQVPGLTIDNILITTGSQQGLDLLGKLFIDPGDSLIVEDPTYLGALQAFSVYEPQYHPVTLTESGINLDELNETIKTTTAKFLYLIPNFHNPTGISYDRATREGLAKLAKENNLLLVEDDPYVEIRFSGEKLPPVATLAPENTFHLGSFSKAIAPGLRLGWICAPNEYIGKLIMLKEGADLHTDHLTQRIAYRFLSGGHLENHLEEIRRVYREQAAHFKSELQRLLPELKLTNPEGGMFLWATLPDGLSSSALFKEAVEANVAFVPGKYFFARNDNDSCLRLNFSNANSEKITEGVTALAKLINR